MEDYECVILSMCRSTLRQTEIDHNNIDDLIEEIKEQFYSELNKENIIIPIKDIFVKEYIKNLIYINNLFAEIEEESEPENIVNIDEDIYHSVNHNMNNSTVSILSSINNFYE